MAHIERFKRTQLGVLEHNSRTDEDRPRTHTNTDIDSERTHLNYELCERNGTARQRWTERMAELHCMKRDDVTVLDSLVVTLPDGVKVEDERRFFESVYTFACAEYGEKNIVNATVHKDETTPHIHIGFIPVVQGKTRKGEDVEKVCHSKLVTKQYLFGLHPRMSEWVSRQLGYDVELMNGATANGNKSIMELKADRATQRHYKTLEEIKTGENTLNALERKIDANMDELKHIEEDMLNLSGIKNKTHFGKKMIVDVKMLEEYSDLKNSVAEQVKERLRINNEIRLMYESNKAREERFEDELKFKEDKIEYIRQSLREQLDFFRKQSKEVLEIKENLLNKLKEVAKEIFKRFYPFDDCENPEVELYRQAIQEKYGTVAMGEIVGIVEDTKDVLEKEYFENIRQIDEDDLEL